MSTGAEPGQILYLAALVQPLAVNTLPIATQLTSADVGVHCRGLDLKHGAGFLDCQVLFTFERLHVWYAVPSMYAAPWTFAGSRCSLLRASLTGT